MMVDRAVVARVERTLADGLAATARSIAALHPGLGATAVAVGGGQAVVCGRGMWVNRVVGLGIDRPVTDADLDVVDGLFAAADLPLEIEVNPWAHATLLTGVAARVMAPTWFRSLLVRRLTVDDERVALPPPVAVRPAPSVGEWQEVSAVGFGYDDDARRRANDVSAEAAHHAGDILLVATIDGRPAGAAALGTALGVAALYGTSTVPGARRRGVQAALITARLAHAAAAGCDLAVSTAEPGGDSERNLLRHGFQVVGTKVGVRRPPPWVADGPGATRAGPTASTPTGRCPTG